MGFLASSAERIDSGCRISRIASLRAGNSLGSQTCPLPSRYLACLNKPSLFHKVVTNVCNLLVFADPFSNQRGSNFGAEGVQNDIHGVLFVT